jgi:predicted ester cyclase
MESEREDLLVFYSRYFKRCNEHRFDELGEFVADDVNGPTKGLSRYIAGLRAVIEAFPDYQWELQHLLVDGQGLAARLYGTGTHTGPFRGIAATGRVIRTQELVIYRIGDNKIVDCWGDLGSTVRDELTSGSPVTDGASVWTAREPVLL